MVKNNSYRALQSILLVLAVCFILMFSSSFTSAFEFDNKIEYKEEDMKVEFSNSFLGIFKTDKIGEIELKSHKSVSEILKVAPGKDVVTMYYDFNFNEEYENGLGVVEFINMSSGEYVDKDYNFVIKTSVIKEKNNYSNKCENKYNESNKTYIEACIQIVSGTYFETTEEWVTLNKSDIPSGNITIGISTTVKAGETIDGIWTIAGKKINKHAQWTSNLNTGIKIYYKLDEESGTIVIDSTTNKNNATNNGALVNQTGLINKAYYLDGGIDYLDIDTPSNLDDNSTGSISIWLKTTDTTQLAFILSPFKDSLNRAGLFNGASGMTWGLTTSGSFEGTSAVTWNNNEWTNWIITHNGTMTKFYKDGVLKENLVTTKWLDDFVTMSDFWIGRKRFDSSSEYNGYMDEISIWGGKVLTDGGVSVGQNATGEVEQLYNNGSGITFIPIEITLNSPINNSRLLKNENILFNISLESGLELKNITLYINEIENETINISGKSNNTIFNKNISELGEYNWKVNVCDQSNSCLFSEKINFIISSFIVNSATLNSTSFETATETFILNITKNTPTITASLFYNGTEYTTTKSGNIFTRTIQIPVGQLGNNTIFWRLDGSEDSDNYYQQVNETVLTLCNATYSTTFLNISFKDESDLSIINASIPTSTFTYWLGDGTVTKTYTFINNTDNFNYEFCATPNRTINLNSLIQYKQGSSYPQRVYSQEAGNLINSTTDLILYLLGVSDGLYVTFQVTNVADQAIEGVDILATRVLEGSTTPVAQGTTDAAGSTTFWLNPDFQHTITFEKTGLITETLTIFPTQSAYTITMGGGEITEPDQTRGVSLVVKPQVSFIVNDTSYNFNYTVSSTYWNLEEFGFTLYYSNGTEIGTETSTASAGGILDLDANTLNSSYIKMNYYYLINSTYTNGTRIWYVQNTEGTEYSLSNFFSRLTIYIDAGLFGFDDFGKALISFLILVLVAGGLSYRYGINSEVAIMGIIFGLVLFLDVGLGLIPNPTLATQAGIENIVTIIIGILLFGILAKEELR